MTAYEITAAGIGTAFAVLAVWPSLTAPTKDRAMPLLLFRPGTGAHRKPDVADLRKQIDFQEDRLTAADDLINRLHDDRNAIYQSLAAAELRATAAEERAAEAEERAVNAEQSYACREKTLAELTGYITQLEAELANANKVSTRTYPVPPPAPEDAPTDPTGISLQDLSDAVPDEAPAAPSAN